MPSAGYLRGAPVGGRLGRAVHMAVCQTSPRVPTISRTALTVEVLPFNLPVLISIIKPQLISSPYGFAGEQRDTWEAQVLVFGEHSHRKQIGLTQVVHKPTDIAIELGIDAVDLANLIVQVEHVRVVVSDVRFSV